MHVILLSGGSGKRLWPLSNEIRSKQFLKILKDGSGNQESMIQRVYRQIKETELCDSVIVAAGADQKDQIRMQLGKGIELVLEPERRDTFPAVMLACGYLYSEKKVDSDHNVVILPVDSFVENEFFERIKSFSDVLGKSASGLVLLGAKPSYPAENFGYIMPLNQAKVTGVEYFKEKPDRKTAEKMIQEGALWNCGVLGFKLGYMLELLKKRSPSLQMDYNRIYTEYSQLNKNSIDYEVIENTDSISVVRYDGYWKDLGTWKTLVDEMGEQTQGNVIMDDGSQSSHVINEQNIPLIVIGVKNSVIVSTYDGILVADKSETSKLKSIVTKINQRPMYEVKRWGSYQVLEHSIHDDGMESLTKKIFINENSQISYQYHNERSEIWTILSGSGIVTIDGEERTVEPNSVIKIDRHQKHAIKAVTNLEMIEVQLGGRVSESDIVRLRMDW